MDTIVTERTLRTAVPVDATTAEALAQEKRYCAKNYKPLPVSISRARGAWLWDSDGRRYLDMMSAYSAVNVGHGHPRVLKVLTEQVERVAIVSRAFHTDRLGPFLARLCDLAGLDGACPMNTGAEAVETAIKAARRWGYTVKGIARNQAEIIVANGNFHGRTTTIVGFSSEEEYRDGFGPFAPGFRHVPFGDAAALEAAIGPNTAAVLLEPIQGEAGIIVPPPGYLKAVRAACDRHNVLLILDEIQSGLGRTGRWFAFQHEGIRPDGLCLGKALGGGVMPVSAFLGRADVIAMFKPGNHGSTFGGNPLAAAVGLEALNVIDDEGLVERSARLGTHLINRLRSINSPLIKAVRGIGLWVGVEIDPALASARTVCEALMQRGVLSKETHETVIRLAPPLVITEEDLDWAIDRLQETLFALDSERAAGRIPQA
jgi:ornithine--oxo-acid transaminase